MQHLLVDQAHRLVGQAGRQGAHLEGVAASISARRDQGTRPSGNLIQVVEDRRTVDQHLAAVEDQSGHPAERIELSDPIGVGEG